MLQKLIEFVKITEALDIDSDAKNLLILKAMSTLLREDLTQCYEN